jgi:glycosyltransferase involved in cell wall biosynthesis
MNGAPRLACIIPVFNGRRDLRRAVESALAQRADIQVVLVDDRSTDGSTDFVLELAAAEPRIAAICLARNGGQSHARNIGVAAAQAPYVTFLDQDDEHIAGWYDHAIGELDASPECAAVKGSFELTGLPPDVSFAPGDARLPAMSNSVIWNMVMRKAAYQALGGCPSGPAFRTRAGVEDIAFMMAFERHFSIARTDYPATLHYANEGGAGTLFLRRTRVVGQGFEYIESLPIEQDRSLQDALDAYQAQAAANIAAIGAALK